MSAACGKGVCFGRLLRGAVVAALPLVCAANAPAGQPGADMEKARERERVLVEAARRVAPAFVFIGGGSGVMISADGLMLTNHHVAGSSKNWQVRVGDKLHKARVLGVDPYGDIALLQLENAAKMPFVEFCDSDVLEIGQEVIAVGNPFGAADVTGEPTVTYGIVSCLHRFLGGYTDAIQTDAPVNPGNSGGPLLTLSGRLAGINGRIQTRFGLRANTGIGLAIPSNQIKRFLPALQAAQGGRVFHGHLRGLVGETEEKDNLQNGAEIKEVRPGSPAEQLGFKAGDRITELNGFRLLNFFRFRGLMGTYPQGSEVTLKYQRDGKTFTLKTNLEKLDPGSLGCRWRPATKPGDPVVVEEVYPKLAADRAGMKKGDILLEFDGKPAGTYQELAQVYQEMFAGDAVKVKVRRPDKDGKPEELELSLTLTSRYDDPRRAPRRPAPRPGPRGKK
jgi:S1-C subfamily serine protease